MAHRKLHPHNKPVDVFDRMVAYTEWGVLETASNDLEDRVEILSKWCESMGFFQIIPSVESNTTIIPEQEQAVETLKAKQFDQVFEYAPDLIELDNDEEDNQSDLVVSRAWAPRVSVRFRDCKAKGDSCFSQLNDVFEVFFVPMDGHCGYSSILCGLTDLDVAVEVKCVSELRKTLFHFAKSHPDRCCCNSDFRRMSYVEYVDQAIIGRLYDPG